MAEHLDVDIERHYSTVHAVMRAQTVGEENEEDSEEGKEDKNNAGLSDAS